MADWNAATYHRVSSPQLRWGLLVLDRLKLTGAEHVIDVGCGTGRLTEHLAWRVPRGRVIGVDRSSSMLSEARTYIAAVAGSHVAVVQADGTALPFCEVADAVFSTATFHWVLDHDALFRSLYSALRPGGRLVAQCGGGPNIARFVNRATMLIARPPFASYFDTWREPWLFADAATTATRLAAAGFKAVDTSEERAPVVFGGADEFREFASTVVCRPYLQQLGDPALQTGFMDLLVEQYAADTPPFELDYWRLNLSARKPV